jgi:hypothetical protein
MSFAQAEVKDLEDDFKTTYELSGITIRNDTLYAVSERCEKIFLLNKKSLEVIKTIDLSGFFPTRADTVEIESLLLYNNHLYMTDELNLEIMDYDLALGTLDKFKGHGFTNEYKNKIEGIAIKNDKMYVLIEKNKKSQSEIHLFKVDFKTKSLSPMLKILINVPENSRYSDICFDNHTGKLMGLRTSYFRDDMKKNEYVIDEINLSGIRRDVTGDVVLNSEDFVSISNLTAVVQNPPGGKTYTTNLEGLTSDSKFIYVVSDNGKYGLKKCSAGGDLPFFIKVKR